MSLDRRISHLEANAGTGAIRYVGVMSPDGGVVLSQEGTFLAPFVVALPSECMGELSPQQWATKCLTERQA